MLRFLSFFICLSYINLVSAASPWLPEPGSTVLKAIYIDESFDEFFRGDVDAELPADIKQQTTSLLIAYGLSDNLAVDMKLGYTKTSFEPSTEGDFSGRDDSYLGLSWRLKDEYAEDAMTLSLRLGLIFAGDYESSSPGNPHSPGDGASGMELSVLFGKMLNENLAYAVNIGYRDRESPVASDLLVGAHLYYWLSAKWNVRTAYKLEQASNGVDIGDPGVNPSRFNELKEESTTIQLGITHNLSQQFHFGLDLAKTIDGRNTGKKSLAILSAGWNF